MKMKRILLTFLSLLLVLGIINTVQAETPTVTIGTSSFTTNATSYTFNCSATVSGENDTLNHIMLYTDFNSTWQWHINWSTPGNGTGNTSSIVYNATDYGNVNGNNWVYNCYACDNDTVQKCAYASANNTMTWDNTAPVVTDFIPEKKAGSKATIKFTVNGDSTTCKYSTSDVVYSSMSDLGSGSSSSTFKKELEYFETGENTWYVRCRDDHWNVASSSTAIIVRKTVSGLAPVLIAAGMKAQQQQQQQSITVAQKITQRTSLMLVGLIAIVVIVFIIILFYPTRGRSKKRKKKRR